MEFLLAELDKLKVFKNISLLFLTLLSRLKNRKMISLWCAVVTFSPNYSVSSYEVDA